MEEVAKHQRYWIGEEEQHNVADLRREERGRGRGKRGGEEGGEEGRRGGRGGGELKK